MAFALGDAIARAWIQIGAKDEDAKLALDDLKLKTKSLADKVYSIKIKSDDAGAKASLLDLQLKMDRFSKRVYTAKADLDTRPAELAMLRLDALASRVDKKYGGSGGGGLFSRLLGGFRTGARRGNIAGRSFFALGTGGLSELSTLLPGISNPYVGTAALAALPAISPVLGAGLAGGGFALAAAAGYKKAHTDLQNLQKAELAYNSASTAAAKKAAAVKVAAAKAAFTAPEREMANQITSLQNLLSSALKQVEPFIATIGGTVLGAVKPLLGALKPLIYDGGYVVKDFVQPLAQLFGSRAFHQAIDQLGLAGVAFAKLAGPEVAKILGAIVQMFAQLAPAGEQLWKALGPLVTVLVDQFVKTLTPLLPPLTKALAALLGAITPLIPPLAHMLQTILPPLVNVFGRVLVDAIGGLAKVINDVLIPQINWITEKALKPVAKALDWFYGHWKQVWGDVWDWMKRTAGDIRGTFDTFVHDVEQLWNNLWNSTIGAAERFNTRINNDIGTGLRNVTGLFRRLPGDVIHAMEGLGTDLYNFAHMALTKLWHGAESMVRPITNFFSGFAHGIVGIFRKIWGWFSPSSVMYEGGKALMEGLAKGIKDHAHKAQAAVTGAATSVSGGSGVDRWRGLVDRVLAMEHLPTGLDTRVLNQMMSESGGNPRAINLTDINAQRGDPSRGLMQVIGSTFAAYHWPGTSWDIYDPEANIAAAINYARHVYGPSLMANGMGIGSMKGYDTGGWLLPGLTLAYNGTGRPERVVGPHEPAVVLEVGTAGGNSTFDQFLLTWIKRNVRVKGGGNVQVAFGRQ